MYCGNCGAKLPDNAAFCPKCGEAVETAAAEPMGSLVDRARAGDQGALQALYEQTYAQVYYTVKSMIKSEDDVFDILQDSYLKAFSHLDRFTSGAEFTPWIKTIAANTARDWLKKRRPMLFSELAGAEAFDTPPEEYFADDRPEHLPEQVLDQKETVRLVREIIETLPEDQRAAIGMFYYEELSVRQIAAAMGVSESAVKSRLAYGRQKIEKKVRELEKKGTKLYGLSPIPFLLWLLRGLESREAVQPDSTVLGRILRDLPPAEAVPAGAGGTAIGAGHAAAIGAGKAAAIGAGKAAAIGAGKAAGIGGLKLALILLGSVAVIGASIGGIVKLHNSRTSSRKPSVVAVDQQAPAGQTDLSDLEQPEPGEDASAAPVAVPETEPTEAATTAPLQPEDPLDAAMEAYREIMDHADRYDFGLADLQATGWRWALEYLEQGDPVPSLLLSRDQADDLSHIRVFQYVPDTGAVLAPSEIVIEGTAQTGGLRATLMLFDDGSGLRLTEAYAGSADFDVYRITLEGEALTQAHVLSGRVGEDVPANLTSHAIDWHEGLRLDLSPAQTTQTTEPEAPSPEEQFRAAEQAAGRIVLQGRVEFASYDRIIQLQGRPDPNAAAYTDAQRSNMSSRTYPVIVLDEPVTLTLNNAGELVTGETRLISFREDAVSRTLDGQTVTFSIDPASSWWPSDTGLPLGAAGTSDLNILD